MCAVLSVLLLLADHPVLAGLAMSVALLISAAKHINDAGEWE